MRVTLLFQYLLFLHQCFETHSSSVTYYYNKTNLIFEILLPQSTMRGIDVLFISKDSPSSFVRNGEWVAFNICLMKNYDENTMKNLNAETMIVIAPENITSLFSQLKHICKMYLEMRLHIEHPWWKPNFFLIWPIGNSTNYSQLFTYLSKQNYTDQLLLDSDVYIIPYVSQSKIEIWELYTLNGIMLLQKLNFTSIHDLSFIQRKATRRGDFKKTVLTAVGVLDSDYEAQCHIEYRNGKSIGVVGLCVEIIADLKYTLNFTLKMIYGNAWIGVSPNGSLSGIAKQVSEGDAVIATSHSLYLPYRITRLTFLQPTETSNTEFFFIQPEPTSIRDIYLSPFKKEVWGCFCITWVLIIISIKIFAETQYNFLDNQNDLEQDAERAKDAILWSVGTISQQGWHTSPFTIPMRIIVIFSLFYGLIIYVAFSASLVSNLADQNVPIKSFKNLIESTYKILADVSIPSNIVGLLPKHKFDEIKWMSIEDGIKNILKKPSSSAYVTFPDGFRTVYDRLNLTSIFYCESLYKIKPTKAPYHSGMIIKKGSEYKEFFNHRIILIKEIGLNRRYNIRYIGETCGPQNNRRREMRGLGIHDLFTAYVILIFGFCVSFISLLIEIFYTHNLVKTNIVNTNNY